MIDIKKNPETVGKLKVGTSAATPADGELTVSGNVTVGGGTASSLVSGGDSPVLAIGGTDSGLVNGDKAGAISFITSDGSYTTTYSDGICGEITSVADTATGAAYGLAFHTATTTNSNRAERLRISSTGLATFTRDAGSVIIADRTSSDGDVIGIKKDDVTRLRIGTDGITFANGAGAAPTAAAANQLDYYEEGTWTPVYDNAQSSSSGTWDTSLAGTYTRVGDLVTVKMLIGGTSMDFSSTNGYRRYSGLPFQPAEVYAGAWTTYHAASGRGVAGANTTSKLTIYPTNTGSGTSNVVATITYKV